MKIQFTLLLFVIILLTSGCIRPPDVVGDITISLVSPAGKINEPLFNGMPFNYNMYVQPGDKVFIDWQTSKNQYNEPTGLSDDTQWRIHEVRIHCSEKQDDDSVYWPDSYQENTMFWFPTWTGPLSMNGLPYLMRPLSLQPILRPNYPWDSCAPHPIPASREQTATIYVTAKAEWIRVSLNLPENPDGYSVQWPGNPVIVHTSGGILSKRVDTHGEIAIMMSDGTVKTKNIPVDWFYVDAVFYRLVGPAGECD